MVDLNDWRLQAQEKYLQGALLFYKNYADRKTETDHDHCEFCRAKLSDTIANALQAGYTTEDNYRWICKQCFEDFKHMFQFKVGGLNDQQGV